MRFPLLACAILAACGGDAPVGITVEFDAPPGVESVEVFVATPCTRGCDGRTGPPGVAPISRAQLWEVPNAGDGPFVIDADEALLLVTDTNVDQKIELLAAIGYDANGTAIAAYIHYEPVLIVAGNTEHWRLTLQPATDIVPGEDAPDGAFRIRGWRRSDALMPSCAVIEHGGERFALGPVGDRDCDELATTEDAECAPWIYRADNVPPSGGIGSAVCGTTVGFQVGYPSACLAGGRACSEIGPPGTTCTRLSQDVCVTPDLCNCPDWNESCLRERLRLPPVTSYVSCRVCSDGITFPPLALNTILGPVPNTCSDVRLHELSDSLGPLDESATFATGEIKIVDKADCTVRMEWSGMTSVDPDIAFLSMDLSTGKHMIVPLYIEYGTNCAPATETCVVHSAVADPGRWCAEPPEPTTCGADAVCRSGPWCGSKCCNAGESCVNGDCKCGMGSPCPIGEICGLGPMTGNCGSGCCAQTGPNACF